MDGCVNEVGMTGAWYARGICDPGCRTREGKCSNLDGLRQGAVSHCAQEVTELEHCGRKQKKRKKSEKKVTRDSGVS